MSNDFDEKRYQALIDLDIEWARNMAKDHVTPTHPMPSDETLMVSLHKARTAVEAIPEELREASRQWLRARGYRPYG